MSIDNVNDLPPRVQYVASAAQTSFPYTFPIFSDADLVVYVDGVLKSLTTHYTVTGAGDDTGGTINFGTPMTGGEIVTVIRDIAIERTTDISQNGQWQSGVYNDEQDRIFLILQQLKADFKRSLRIPVMAEVDDDDIELTVANFANMYLTFDADGKPTPAALSATAITQEIIGQLLYPMETGETGVTNFGYKRGNVLRYGADPTGVSSSSAALANAVSSLPTNGGTLEVPAGTYRLTSKWLINKLAHIVCSTQSASEGAVGGTTFVKASTLNDTAIEFIIDGSSAEGFVLGGEVGNGGDGIQIGANTTTLRRVSVYGQGRDGFRVGYDGTGNCNFWRLDQCNAKGNGRHGVHIHSNTSGSPDCNAGTATNVDSTNNGTHGFYIRNALRNTFVGLLTEVNGGDGVRVDSPALENSFFGGDFSEGNTGADIRVMPGAFRTMFFGVGVNNGEFVDDGDETMFFGANNSSKLSAGTGAVLTNGAGPDYSGNEAYVQLAGDAEGRIRFGWKDGTPSTGLVAAQVIAGPSTMWLASRDTSGAEVRIVAGAGLQTALRAGASGGNPTIGFLGAAPVTRPAVTGSRGGNAALASLLTQLASLGLITDSTSA